MSTSPIACSGISELIDLFRIIRILGMVPVYCLVAVLSVGLELEYICFQIIMRTYEAVTIANSFVLVLNYTASGIHKQRKYLRSIEPISWAQPVKFFRSKTPRIGLTFLL